MGANAAGRVYAVGVMPYEAPAARKLMDEYKAKFNDDFYTAQIYNAYALLSAAMAKAKSTDPVKVAATLEGLKSRAWAATCRCARPTTSCSRPLYISVWQKAGAEAL